MKFKDWFDGKLIEVKDKEQLDKIGTHNMSCPIDILKKVYNAYKHTGILDRSEILIVRVKDDDKDVYRIVVDDEYLCIDSIIDYMVSITGYKIMKELDKDTLKREFMFVPKNPNKELEYDDKYYFLITLNPNKYEISYIEKIEDLIGPHITHYNSVSGILDEFIELLQSNDFIRCIISGNWEGLGIMAFNSEEEFYEYIKERTLTRKLEDYISIPISEDKMIEIAEQIKNNKLSGTIYSISLNKNNDNNGSLLN